MSRGHGKVQKSIIRYFEENPTEQTSIIEIAGTMLDKEWISYAQYESYRRAMKKLVSEGLVFKNPDRTHYGYYQFCTRDTHERYQASVEKFRALFSPSKLNQQN